MVSICLTMSLVCFFLLKRILVKTMSRKFHKRSTYSFEDLAQDCYFVRLHNGSRNIFVNKSEGNCFFHFSINVVKTCSYGLKVSRNMEIRYLFHFKAYFHVLGTVHTSCLIAYNDILDVKCNRLLNFKNMQDNSQEITLSVFIFNS